MIAGSIILWGFSVPWDRLSNAGNWAVVGFGLLLWVFCLFSLFFDGMGVMLMGQRKRAKHKRGSQAKVLLAAQASNTSTPR